MLVGICNPDALNIKIFNLKIALQMLILHAGGLQLAFPSAADRWFHLSVRFTIQSPILPQSLINVKNCVFFGST